MFAIWVVDERKFHNIGYVIDSLETFFISFLMSANRDEIFIFISLQQTVLYQYLQKTNLQNEERTLKHSRFISPSISLVTDDFGRMNDAT